MENLLPSKPFDISIGNIDLRFQYLRMPSPSDVEHMADSLKKHGQLTPITATGDEKSPIIIDGFKRFAAASLVGLASMRVSLLTAGAGHAKILMYLMNKGRGFTLLQEALLVKELVEIEGYSQIEVANMLERHKSWVCRRFGLSKQLSPQICEEIKLDLLPPGSASSLARLPPSNQADFSTTIQKNGLSSHEIMKLVDLWLKAKDPALKKFLLESPRESLNIVNNKKEEEPTVRWKRLLIGVNYVLGNIEKEAGEDGTNINYISELLTQIDNTEQFVVSSLNRLRILLSGGIDEQD